MGDRPTDRIAPSVEARDEAGNRDGGGTTALRLASENRIVDLEAGRLSDAGLNEMNRNYAVVIRRAKRNYSADCPDVPGCVAAGRTVDETLRRIRSALSMHLRSMREDGLRAPRAATPLAKLVRRNGVDQIYAVVRVAA
jgi:predicted RNase H-like HicB family nuclease